VLHEVNVVLERIDALLGEAPPVPELERTLTDGYATALALEGERIRIDRRMDGVAASIEEDPDGAKELSALAERRARVDSELRHLRERLGLLKQRMRELRSAVPQPGLG
jgi:chromosome segregation ATPase